jgi:hypothetical protein
MNILQSEQVNRRLVVIAAISVAALTAGAIWLAFSLLHPTPPRLVAMAISVPSWGTDTASFLRATGSN